MLSGEAAPRSHYNRQLMVMGRGETHGGNKRATRTSTEDKQNKEAGERSSPFINGSFPTDLNVLDQTLERDFCRDFTPVMNKHRSLISGTTKLSSVSRQCCTFLQTQSLPVLFFYVIHHWLVYTIKWALFIKIVLKIYQKCSCVEKGPYQAWKSTNSM